MIGVGKDLNDDLGVDQEHRDVDARNVGDVGVELEVDVGVAGRDGAGLEPNLRT